jgi:hypothetical protein
MKLAIPSLLAIVACSAVVVAEKAQFVESKPTDLSRCVGGTFWQCCIKSKLTKCQDLAPFACLSTTVSCSTSAPVNDRCVNASCSDDSNVGDSCNLNSSAQVQVTQCTATSNTPQACGDNNNMQDCPFTTAIVQITITGCGSSSLCASGQPASTCGG